MKRKRPIINSALILILILLLGWGIQGFLHPKFPVEIKGEGIRPEHRVLEVPNISRKVYSQAIVEEVIRLNLFRKERKKYYRPKPPKPKPRPQPKVKPVPPKVALAPPPPPPPQPTAPPPQLILTGVMLMDGQKVAIFEGTYSEVRGGRLVQNLKPRRRGYRIGESLGTYKIEGIDKTHATLTALAGSHLTLTISKTPPNQKIQKTGSSLIQKSKRVSTDTPKSSPVLKNRRSRRIPIKKKLLKKGIPPGSLSPQLTPPTQAPDQVPSNPGIVPRLRQKSMGF